MNNFRQLMNIYLDDNELYESVLQKNLRRYMHLNLYAGETTNLLRCYDLLECKQCLRNAGSWGLPTAVAMVES